MDGYHAHIDITSHLGTHLEFPYHFRHEWKDGMKLPIESFLGRGILLNLETARPRELIRTEDLEQADRGRIRPGGHGSAGFSLSQHALCPLAR